MTEGLNQPLEGGIFVSESPPVNALFVRGNYQNPGNWLPSLSFVRGEIVKQKHLDINLLPYGTPPIVYQDAINQVLHGQEISLQWIKEMNRKHRQRFYDGDESEITCGFEPLSTKGLKSLLKFYYPEWEISSNNLDSNTEKRKREDVLYDEEVFKRQKFTFNEIQKANEVKKEQEEEQIKYEIKVADDLVLKQKEIILQLQNQLAKNEESFNLRLQSHERVLQELSMNHQIQLTLTTELNSFSTENDKDTIISLKETIKKYEKKIKKIKKEYDILSRKLEINTFQIDEKDDLLWEHQKLKRKLNELEEKKKNKIEIVGQRESQSLPIETTQNKQKEEFLKIQEKEIQHWKEAQDALKAEIELLQISTNTHELEVNNMKKKHQLEIQDLDDQLALRTVLLEEAKSKQLGEMRDFGMLLLKFLKSWSKMLHDGLSGRYTSKLLAYIKKYHDQIRKKNMDEEQWLKIVDSLFGEAASFQVDSVFAQMLEATEKVTFNDVFYFTNFAFSVFDDYIKNLNIHVLPIILANYNLSHDYEESFVRVSEALKSSQSSTEKMNQFIQWQIIFSHVFYTSDFPWLTLPPENIIESIMDLLTKKVLERKEELIPLFNLADNFFPTISDEDLMKKLKLLFSSKINIEYVRFKEFGDLHKQYTQVKDRLNGIISDNSSVHKDETRQFGLGPELVKKDQVIDIPSLIEIPNIYEPLMVNNPYPDDDEMQDDFEEEFNNLHPDKFVRPIEIPQVEDPDAEEITDSEDENERDLPSTFIPQKVVVEESESSDEENNRNSLPVFNDPIPEGFDEPKREKPKKPKKTLPLSSDSDEEPPVGNKESNVPPETPKTEKKKFTPQRTENEELNKFIQSVSYFPTFKDGRYLGFLPGSDRLTNDQIRSMDWSYNSYPLTDAEKSWIRYFCENEIVLEIFVEQTYSSVIMRNFFIFLIHYSNGLFLKKVEDPLIMRDKMLTVTNEMADILSIPLAAFLFNWDYYFFCYVSIPENLTRSLNGKMNENTTPINWIYNGGEIDSSGETYRDIIEDHEERFTLLANSLFTVLQKEKALSLNYLQNPIVNKYISKWIFYLEFDFTSYMKEYKYEFSTWEESVSVLQIFFTFIISNAQIKNASVQDQSIFYDILRDVLVNQLVLNPFSTKELLNPISLPKIKKRTNIADSAEVIMIYLNLNLWEK